VVRQLTGCETAAMARAEQQQQQQPRTHQWPALQLHAAGVAQALVLLQTSAAAVALTGNAAAVGRMEAMHMLQQLQLLVLL
jgi:hypothetical protein